MNNAYVQEFETADDGIVEQLESYPVRSLMIYADGSTFRTEYAFCKQSLYAPG